MRAEILYEDKDILVARKPAGLAVQSARVGSQDMESELKNYLARHSGDGRMGRTETPYLGIVHRLDQPVEGVLVFGRNKKAAAALSSQIRNRIFCKEYLAVVTGCPAKEEGVLENLLVKEGGRAKVYAARPEGKIPEGARTARLSYRTEQRAKTAAGEISLIRIWLETGRFHQIRAQFACAGFPILGDAGYGNGQSARMAEELGIRFTALCACRLRFCHPEDGRELEYTVAPENPAFSFFQI